MKSLTTISLLLISLTLAPIGFASQRSDAATAAHDLQNTARHFTKTTHHKHASRTLTKAARNFTRAARHFHEQVESKSSARHLHHDLMDLEDSFYCLKDAFRNDSSSHYRRHLRRDFKKVKAAMRYLRHEMESRSTHQYSHISDDWSFSYKYN